MGDGTKIEWADATWNPIAGCSVVSPGCTNCYAMRLAGGRLRNHPTRAGLTQPSNAGPVWTGEVRFNARWIDQPLRWRRPRRIFVCAHGDLFHEAVPDDWIDQIFAIMALTPQHTFLVLTKRADRMREYFQRDLLAEAWWEAGDRLACKIDLPVGPGEPYLNAGKGKTPIPLPNTWLGVSVEDQERADERIPELLATPAAVRWISAEPLLGPISLEECLDDYSRGMTPSDRAQQIRDGITYLDAPCGGLDWIVCGGESGSGARPMHPNWARSLRDQCSAAGVPFFFKQWGEHWPAEVSRIADTGEIWRRKPDGSEVWLINEFKQRDPAPVKFLNLGKRSAGRRLDGREWNEFPEPRR